MEENGGNKEEMTNQLDNINGTRLGINLQEKRSTDATSLIFDRLKRGTRTAENRKGMNQSAKARER